MVFTFGGAHYNIPAYKGFNILSCKVLHQLKASQYITHNHNRSIYLLTDDKENFETHIIFIFTLLLLKNLQQALSRASNFIDICNNDISIIKLPRKSLLFYLTEKQWVQKIPTSLFQVTIKHGTF